MKDGRLTGDALEQHLGHVERCPDCARESHALQALSARVRSLPTAPVDEFALRRGKRAVLCAVDAGLAGRDAPPRFDRVRGAAIVLAAVALVGFGTRALRPRSAFPGSVVEVSGAADTLWTARVGGDARRIDLRSGTLHLHVTRHDGEKGVVVQVPDGEIVDIGTRFSVTVEDLRTRRVAVDEGRVALHLNDGTNQEVASGETWEAPASKGSAPPAAVPLTSAVPRPPPAASPPHGHPSMAAPSVRPGPSVRAASRLVPDASEEDSAYLSVVALLRAGRVDDARAAARGYLQKFPGAFREPEMRRVADALSPGGR